MRHFIVTVVLVASLGGCATTSRGPVIERLPEGAVTLDNPRPAPLTLAKVAEMAREDTPAPVIIQALRDSRASYRISLEEARELSAQGVPYEVVEYLRYGERVPVAFYPPPPVHWVHPSHLYFPSLFYSYSRGPRLYPWPHYPVIPRSGVYLRFGARR